MPSHFFPHGLPSSRKSRAKKPPAIERLRSRFRWFQGTGRFSDGLQQDISLAATTNINVLVVGETGTGKEIVAQWIHEERRHAQGLAEDDAPFTAVNCAAIPENLVESILFGHERGAFTSARQSQRGKFEVAKKGTLFLDEIQNLGLPAQSKLLRVVQNREVERLGASKSDEIQCQIIAASNVPLELLIDGKTFRKDLYYRLNICPIYLPALRHRKEDLPSLIKFFLQKISTYHQLPMRDLSPTAFEALLNHSWPGNLRELEHSLLYASLRAGAIIESHDLPGTLTGNLHEYIKNGAWLAHEA